MDGFIFRSANKIQQIFSQTSMSFCGKHILQNAIVFSSSEAVNK